MLFPFIDLKTLHKEIHPELQEAVDSLLGSSSFIMGDAVDAFEREMREYTGCDYALGVDSGTRALELIYRALGIGPGDEVITSPFSFVATTSSILQVGATPVFADVDPETMNIDPEEVKKKISSATRAITPVHLFGKMADLERLQQVAGAIPLIEDACQAIGGRNAAAAVGGVGMAAALSFFPTKNLGGAGDGGMVLTNDAKLARGISRLRNHGQDADGLVGEPGCTGRLDALQAAFLRVKLTYLDSWISRRRENAHWYLDNLPSVTVAQTPEPGHVYHQFTIRIPERDAVRRELTAKGIPTAVYYSRPIHLQPLFSRSGYGAGDLPQAESLSREVLSLPVGPCLCVANRQRIVEELKSVLEQMGY